MLSDFESIKKVILNSLIKQKINALQILLIGSIARGDFRNSSDTDIVICFRRNQIPSNRKINDLIKLLEIEIGRKVDLIVFEYVNKFVNHEEYDKNFIENILSDAKKLDNNSKIGKEFVLLSNKIGLFKY